MPVIAVVGGQWGDEGKGKVIDQLAGQADMVIRAHGGDNAGHTVVNELGEFALHLVPAGVFNPEAVCIIAAGVALNPEVLIRELDALEHRGVATSKLLISDRAHLVMPYHLLIDQVQESLKGGNAIGTTGRGIGPAYGDKVERIGFRVGDLLDWASLQAKVRSVVGRKNELFASAGRSEHIDPSEVSAKYASYAERLRPYLADVAPVIGTAVDDGAAILIEGAHGTLLDLDHGTYPYATTSSCTVAGLCQGTGIPPRSITNSIGVFKAYSTRVGQGPMPTELTDSVGEYLRERAHEFGTTTGRARRCGWFDAVSSRYSARINGFDSIAVTRLDILDEMPSLKLSVGYEVDGRRIDHLPSQAGVLAASRPIYEEMAGWQKSICAITRFEDLPSQAIAYVQRLEQLLGAPADFIGVGPERRQTITRRDAWGD